MLLLLYSNYDVRPVNGLWVQSGDGRPDGDVKCAIGTERAQSSVDTSDPASYLKAASGQSGPGSTTLWTRATCV